MSLPAQKTAPNGRREIAGFDCAWTKPNPATMVGLGYQFAVGYLSNDPSKNLLAGQAQAYRNAGLGVGLVWETTADRALGGGTAGNLDGALSETQANAIAYPTNGVIFFAVDFDATPAQYPAIQAYANAFNLATRRPVGIYGSFAVVEHFTTPGRQPVQYGWQTAAWSQGLLSRKACLYQRASHANWPVPAGMSANSFDEDVATQAVPLWGWGV